MTGPILLVVVFAAVALGLSAGALFVSLGARRSARDALGAARTLAGRRAAPEPPERRIERREHDLGPADGEPERRRRHAAPEPDRYPRLRAAADAREVTSQLPRVRDDRSSRTPPPPLPRPGAIGRDR